MLITFNVSNGSGEQLIPREYDAECDNVSSLLDDICDFLEGRAIFRIAALGEERWPVDVRTDFSVFLEQLPSFLESIRSGVAGHIDLYEQGIECKLLFTPDRECYVVSCDCSGHWVPRMLSETIGKTDLIDMMQAVKQDFLGAVENMIPELYRHPWLKAWASDSA